MKTLATVLGLSLSALLTSTAMAGTYEQHRDHATRYQYDERHWQDRDHDRYQDHRHYDEQRRLHRVDPSRDWRVGQVLPRYWEQSRNEVNYRHYKGLNKPGRYQQWYKINSDFVLVNERNNRIVRIIN